MLKERADKREARQLTHSAGGIVFPPPGLRSSSDLGSLDRIDAVVPPPPFSTPPTRPLGLFSRVVDASVSAKYLITSGRICFEVELNSRGRMLRPMGALKPFQLFFCFVCGLNLSACCLSHPKLEKTVYFGAGIS